MLLNRIDENTRISISTDDNDGVDNDRPLLRSVNSEFEDMTIVENDHNRNGTEIQINSLIALSLSSSSLQPKQQLTSRILPVFNNQENKVSLICMVNFFSDMCWLNLLQGKENSWIMIR